VAVAAFAAASITKADPMRTGFSAVRAGIVMFVLPFVFVFYPELLLIEAAKLDPNALPGTTAYLAGYSAGIDWPSLALVVTRVMLGLYLLASALSRFDRHQLGAPETVLRLAMALGVVMHDPMIWGPAVAVSAAYLAWYAISPIRSAQPG